ncbi:MAG: ATP-binding cassette, subfamily multidrug efflux pump [Thermoproteota archaeon]|nr:ATP-binding cassette, subfamily multidrug efflux pump [Thermoproteota archaeon]
MSSHESQNTRPRGPIGPGGRGGPFSMDVGRAKNPTTTLLRLSLYLLRSKLRLLFIGLFVVIGTVASVLGPYYIGRAIDQYIRVGDVQGLLGIVFLLLGIYLTAYIANALQSALMARVAQQVLKQLRKELFENLQTLDLSFFDKHTQGELMSRLTNDIDVVNTALSQSITQLISSFLSIFLILVTMFVLNAWLALGSLLVFPLMVFVTVFIGSRTLSGFRGLQSILGRLNGTMEETISGERVVLAFGRQDGVIKNFDEANEAVRKLAIRANSYAFVIMPLLNIMGSIAVAVVAGLGGWMALQNLVTVGVITSFILYARNFTQPLQQLANLYNTIQSALAGAERIFEIIDMRSEIKDKSDAIPLKEIVGDVVFEHVDFSYDRKTPVLRNVSFHAEPGQIVALVGPTGAGKTTMVNVLGRFYDIQGGSIKIDGIDIKDISADSLRRQLGTVLQDNFLFADTVMANIRYGNLEATDEECIAAAKLANADQFITRLPKGYATMLIERGSNLSQGQRQLLAIARAVVANPKILVLDEATSNVDTRTEIRIQDALLQLMKGRTSFVIAHRLSTIRKADQVLVIRDGEIIERGTHESLLAQKSFYYHLYTSQFRGNPIELAASLKSTEPR